MLLRFILLLGNLRGEELTIYISGQGEDSENCGEMEHPCLTWKYASKQHPAPNKLLFLIPSEAFGHPSVELKGRSIEMQSKAGAGSTLIYPNYAKPFPFFKIVSTDFTLRSLNFNTKAYEDGTIPFLSADEKCAVLLENIDLRANSDGSADPTKLDPFMILKSSSITVKNCNVEDQRNYSHEYSYEEKVACAWNSGCIELSECKANMENTTFRNGVRGFILQRGGWLGLGNDTFDTWTYLGYSDLRRTVRCESEGTLSISAIKTLNGNDVMDDLWMDIGDCKMEKNENGGKYVYFHVNISNVSWSWAQKYELLRFEVEGYGFGPCRSRILMGFTVKGATEKTVVTIERPDMFDRKKMTLDVKSKEFGGAQNVSFQIEYPSGKDNGVGTDVTAEFSVELPEWLDDGQSLEEKEREGRRRRRLIIIIAASASGFVLVVAAVTVVVVVLLVRKRHKMMNVEHEPEEAQSGLLYQSKDQSSGV
ncbi:uncharacterized protein MONOS_9763 [Monocercomonoides exilis]|uniref:uncharacterized protein n=1 Tax=Monocercomonoides exilis TaxID=2049356 RepID=UPI00355A6E71|nr:hypothetical protein MONOS_9763 [Monocercomonoides exilis]|eukprot:MONOS_9763.1-p1 / transcript=MONOS_9763.1 / gene=MONOS_9763 / organism=Monocercomonoides_exilis_PA203 / gene_product=unspecified product / transcript_product=unspecified product / location=Mono_scaffold00416:6701-8137(-) / protein_length=479 / sequence_SO=supercontig / SO=protein_coding / is_pseudo=false